MYIVTDFCLGITKYGLESKVRKAEVEDIRAVVLEQEKRIGASIEILVKPYISPTDFTQFKTLEWSNIGKVSFDENLKATWQDIKTPPKVNSSRIV